MDTPDLKPSDLSSTISSTVSTLSESSFLNDVARRSITPDLISSGSTSRFSSSSITTISSYGSSTSGKCFRMSNVDFHRVGLRGSRSESPYRTTSGDSASQNTPPIVISPPRQEQLIDFAPSPSPLSERIPQGLRTSLAQRLLSLVDARSDGRPIRVVKRSALKDITNIIQTRSSVPGDDECIEDAQCLVYRSEEEFLSPLISPPTFNAIYSDSTFFGSSSRFADIFSPNAPPSSTAPTFPLPDSFKLPNFTGSITRRMSGDIVTSLAAKYQNEYLDDDEDDGVVMSEQFEWEDEMRSVEVGIL